jgi:ribose 5-phosphate isomerase RpiB
VLNVRAYYSAHQGVEHDDTNVLVLGSRVIGVALRHRGFIHEEPET